jgi:16S rRNA (cytosine1402-N4)-methyltransferase
MHDMGYHVPVMAAECLSFLEINPSGVYIDATFGGGGHARMILDQLGPNGRLIAFDQDEDAAVNVPDDERLTFVPHNFRQLARWARALDLPPVDGVFADLGVSSHQFDEAERGFSYRFDAPLDMRMNRADVVTAAQIIASYPEAQLQGIFSQYGEVRNSRTLARAIVQQRSQRPIATIADLLRICEPMAFAPKPRYLAQVFQALRIEVNDELSALRQFLEQSLDVLKPGGKLVVLSYHSLEDRIVKNFLRSGQFDGEADKDFYGNIKRPFKILTTKPVLPSDIETKENSRSHSARLRAGIKL